MEAMKRPSNVQVQVEPFIGDKIERLAQENGVTSADVVRVMIGMTVLDKRFAKKFAARLAVVHVGNEKHGPRS